MSYFYQKELECMEREELRALQLARLRDTVERVYRNVPYYKKRMDEAGIKPEQVKSLEDLKHMPFTLKTDLRDNYPFGTFAVPMEEINRLHASSGTTGNPTVVGYTAQDLRTWAECVARILNSIGVSRGDIMHIAFGYGLFTGGLGLHDAGQLLGAAVVPASVGNTPRQLKLLKDFKTTFLCGTPSYMLHLADQIDELGYKKEDFSLKVGLFGAEPWSEEMRDEIEERLGIQAYDIYGLSEIMGPGVSGECHMKSGMHIHADHFIAEIIDPETGEVLPDGETGELVFTTITKQGIPLIRYRTKDLTHIDSAPCACGRTSPRMHKVTGRSDDMLIIRGVNVFPSQIESVILKHTEVAPHYMIYVDRVNNLDSMEVHIEMTSAMFSDAVKSLEQVEHELAHDIDSVLGIRSKIKLVAPKSIPRSEGKAKRVTDRRSVTNF